MRLLLDLGNSRLKWAIAADGALSHAGSVDYRRGDLLTSLSALIDALPRAPQSVALASVGQAERVAQIRAWADDRLGLSLVVPYTSKLFGSLQNGYEQAEQMGVDRWLAMIAAWHRYHRPVCVVDAGTACTVDLVDAAGQHLGGWIAPGRGLMIHALNQNTADINVAAGEASGWGKSTQAAVAGGVAAGWRGLAWAIRAAAENVLPGCHYVVSGGDADSLLPLINNAEHRPQLVLEGLDLWLPSDNDPAGGSAGR